MAPGRRLLTIATLVLVSSVFAWGAAGRSAGAPSNAAVDGCTCHGAQPTAGVTLTFTGLPTAYVPGQTYDLAIQLGGGATPVPAVGQNQGGFALRVTAGMLMAGTGNQVSEEDHFATHTAAGNDQRRWSLQWMAPDPANGTVTFYLAGNTVNGDGTSQGGFDQWNKAVFTVDTQPATNNTTAPVGTSVPGDTPGPAFAATVVGVVVVALVARRRD